MLPSHTQLGMLRGTNQLLGPSSCLKHSPTTTCIARYRHRNQDTTQEHSFIIAHGQTRTHTHSHTRTHARTRTHISVFRVTIYTGKGTPNILFLQRNSAAVQCNNSLIVSTSVDPTEVSVVLYCCPVVMMLSHS